MATHSAAAPATGAIQRSGADFSVLRWLAVLWLIVWVPAYWRAWGFSNFAHFCDLGVLLICAGLWLRSSLLLSSQVVGMLIGCAAWCFEVGWQFFAKKGLFGGTEFLLDSHVALWVRFLSFYHVFAPIVAIYAVQKLGYDRRGFRLQIAIAVVALVIGRLCGPAQNLNFAFVDPVFHRSFGPAPLHLLVMLAGITVLVYAPAHLLCLRFLPQRNN